MRELTPEERIMNLETELQDIRDERDELACAADIAERQDHRRRDALDMIADIAHAILEGTDLPTPEVIRAEFAGFVERITSRPSTKATERDALMAALGALDDIIAGRMRVVRDAR